MGCLEEIERFEEFYESVEILELGSSRHPSVWEEEGEEVVLGAGGSSE